MAEPGHAPQRLRRSGWLALALGLLAVAAAVRFALDEAHPPAQRITLTAGSAGTTRTLVAHALAAEVSVHGIAAEVVEAGAAQDELARVASGAIDFALVSGAYRIEGYPQLRQVAPLYAEALHLLVRRELAPAVTASLTALRGRSVDLGPAGSATAALATAVLDFAEVPAGAATAPGGYVVHNLGLPELEARAARGDPSALPDAIFDLATVPSKIALALVRTDDYELVPLPFADAFRLGAIISDEPPRDAAAQIERPYVLATEIPAFTYQIEPPVPAAPAPTVGTRLLLVAGAHVSVETVQEVLGAIFASRFARLLHPPLDPSVLALPPRIPLHAGTTAFQEQQKPFITPDSVADLSNTLSVLGALVGGGLFLWQGLRQRRQSHRDALLADFMLRVADRERRIVELELASTLELEPLMSLQRELLELKGEALERFTNGELGGQSMLTDLLMPVNAAREQVGKLLLHVRENIESQAETEGRTATAVWEEAAEASTDAAPEGPEEPAPARDAT